MNNHTKASMVVVGFLLALAASTASAQNNSEPDHSDARRFRSLQSLYVVDADGTVVGRVLGFAGQNPTSNVVAFSLRKNVITLGVVANGFLGSETELLFTSLDCSGTPFFNPVALASPAVLPDTASRTAVLNGKVFSPASSAANSECQFNFERP